MQSVVTEIKASPQNWQACEGAAAQKLSRNSRLQNFNQFSSSNHARTGLSQCLVNI